MDDVIWQSDAEKKVLWFPVKTQKSNRTIGQKCILSFQILMLNGNVFQLGKK